jgi:Protein of unknown function (DUF4231)
MVASRHELEASQSNVSVLPPGRSAQPSGRERVIEMTSIDENAATPSYAMTLANDSYGWYKQAAIRSRVAYKISETALLIVAAAIPTSAVITPGDALVPAILGSVVVVLSGLRAVFHWQDNYLRFSGAREAVEAERRLYNTGAEPYDDRTTRDQILASTVSRIEQDEMKGWVKVAAARPKP